MSKIKSTIKFYSRQFINSVIVDFFPINIIFTYIHKHVFSHEDISTKKLANTIFFLCEKSSQYYFKSSFIVFDITSTIFQRDFLCKYPG
jgi:hypothetical protein